MILDGYAFCTPYPFFIRYVSFQYPRRRSHFFSFFQGTYIRTALEYDFQKNWCDDRCDHYHDDNRSEEIAAHHTECFSLAGNDQRNLTTGDHSDTDSCTLIILISTHLRTKGTANDLCQDRNTAKPTIAALIFGSSTFSPILAKNTGESSI